MTAQDQYIYNYITTHSNIAGPFTIPVVVHVVHYGDAYGNGNNISYDQILWQIAGMNAAFQHDYANYNQEGYGHNYLGYGPQDYSSNPQVRFCLAERGRDSALNVIPFFYNTMSGDTECGVMRYNLTDPLYSSIPNVGALGSYNITNTSHEQALLDVTRPGTEFPNNMYLNIYLVPTICQTVNATTTCNVIGVGTMGPFNSLTGQMDGVIMRSDAFGDNSVTGNAFNLFAPLQEGKIMDHEAGHYLSLYHTFQPDSAQPNGCYGTQLATASSNQCDRHGDFCCDTPPDTNFTPIPFVPVSTLNTCNETYFPSVPATNHLDMNENYMDYSDDNWYNTFTFDQSMRVSAMLDVGGPRHSLVTPSNHALTGVSNTGACHCCLLVAHIIQDLDTTCPGATVNFFTPTGNAFCATSWIWSFPGGTPSSASGATASVVYNTSGLYQVFLTASNGVDTITDTTTVFVLIPTVNITRTNTTDTVCSGTHQNIYLEFTGIPPYNVSICDQNNVVVAVVSNIPIDSAIVLVPVSETSNQFHICSATNGLGCPLDTVNGTASFDVQFCCDNLFVNGDFEALPPGCNITPSTSEMGCGIGTGDCSTFNPTVFPIVPGHTANNGISFGANCVATPVHSTPIQHTELWCQNVNLEQGVQYSLQFDYSGNHSGFSTLTIPYLSGPQQLYVQIKVNGTFIGTPINVPYSSMGTPWHTFVIDFVNTLPTGIDTVCLCQVEAPPPFDINFAAGGFDFLLDNFSIRAMDIPTVYAGADTSLCSGYANIGWSQNDTDGVYLWTPNLFVACDTCFITTASPNTTMQYVITNEQRGCIVTDTVVVSVLDVIVSDDTTSCGGGSVTLTATVTGDPNGHTTLWQPGGQTTDVISVAPLVVTTYVVAITDPVSGCSVTDSVTVYPSNVAVTVNSPRICYGDTALLTANVTGSLGSLIYLWLPGNQTTASISVSPSVTTSYTIVVTDSIGCSDTAISTVIVNSASVTASATPNPACIGSFIQLQATPTGLAPFAYTWLPTTNLGNSAIANPTITNYNGNTITYSVYISDANGCSAVDSVTLTLDPTCCTAQSYTGDTLSTNITSGNYAVNQNLLVVGNVVISATEMLIAPNITITVASGSTLVITNKSHLHACYQMWNGIYVQPGATLVITGSSLIEDAYTAVNYNNAPGANIQLTDAIFNKNQFAVLAQNWNGVVNFSMTNCRVTCRVLPPSPTVTLLTSSFLTSLAQTTLISPLAGQRAFCGVQVMNGGAINVGLAAPGRQNIFDYLDHGIVANNTDVFSLNNRYQNMLQPCSGPPSCANNAGVAIIATDPTLVVGNPATYNKIQVGGSLANEANIFENCWRSVDITRYVNVIVTYNSIFSASTVVSPPNIYNLNGDHGVFIRSIYSITCEVNNNKIQNQATGIHISLSPVGGLAYSTINVRDNAVKASTSPTTFTNLGIQVEGIINVSFLFGNYLNIEGDSVLNASTCIRVRNIRNNVRIFSNPEIRIRPNATTVIGPNRTGIFVQNCYGILVQDNKNVNAFGTALDSNNRNIRGIWIFNCLEATVCNNWIRHVGSCLVFEGSCANSVVRKDRFSFCWDGFVMRNNAVIGQQGGPFAPWDCMWVTGIYHAHTYVFFSPNVNGTSPIHVRSGGPWNPTTNFALPSNQLYIPNYEPMNSPQAACGPTPPTQMQQSLRHQIAQNQLPYSVFPNESRFANQRRLFKELNDNPNLMNGDTILQNFYSGNSPGNLGFVEGVEDDIENGNAVSASLNNAGIVSSTTAEWNQQQFNTIFLSTLMIGIDTLSVLQESDLFAIASQCPNEGGDAVWQARALLNWMLHSSLEFSDSCYSSARVKMPTDSARSYKSKVYPNPNNGSCTIEYDLHNYSSGSFLVIDLTGRVLFATEIDPLNFQQVVELNGLANGPYIYKVFGDGELTDAGSLIISK